MLIILLLIPLVAAADNDFFYVKETPGSYSVFAGDDVDIVFIIENHDRLSPDNVTAYIDKCPVGWDCESKVFSYNKSGEHVENLTISSPSYANSKKYTLYILLESEEETKRGDDRVIITVLPKSDRHVKSEDNSKVSIPKDVPVNKDGPASDEVLQDIEITVPITEERSNQSLPGNISVVIENVERLETSSQFVEYATIVLFALLVFVAVGAYYSFRKA
ncbi:hypothetical protein HQ545_02865 [Candidatus Woesearchaeota archaeon]|nr:hypothetical protein [Candidatus Woesearchaeota archaeon]